MERFYNAVGPTLAWWRADTDKAELTRQDGVTAPALIQFAWRHPTKLVLYVASSNFVPIGSPDGRHHLTAFGIGKPSMYVSVERQNQLHIYRLLYGLRGHNLEPAPAYILTTLNEPGNPRPKQMVGPIHMHPSGRFLYVGNRASGLIEDQGRKFAAGGENTIALFTIDQETGEPRLIQAIDTHGFHPRTFSIDPSGRMLVVANLIELPVRAGDAIKTQPATLATYKVGEDGRLTFVRSYDIETNGLLQFWGGFVRV